MDNVEKIMKCVDIISCIGDDKIGDFSMERLEYELKIDTRDGYFFFLTRGHDNFERSCAEILHGLKRIHPRILCFAVKKYENQEIFGEEFYDGVIFPHCLKNCDESERERRYDDYFLEFTRLFICGKYDPSLDLLIEAVMEGKDLNEIGSDPKEVSTTWLTNIRL